MTSQEEQMLNSLVERVNSTKLTEKDADAEALLQRGFAGQPDAYYILAQAVLVQNIALEQAHSQLAQAQQQVKQLQEQIQQQAQHPAKTSFLGSLLGHNDPPPAYQPAYNPPAAPQYTSPAQIPAQSPAQNPPFQPVNTGYPSQPAYPQQVYSAPVVSPTYVVDNQPSFLRSAVETAAVVAAGALAFEGVEALLYGGYGHPGLGIGMGGWGMPGIGYGYGMSPIVAPVIVPEIGFGGGFMGGGMGYERPIEETVVNNYYETPTPERREFEPQGDSRFSDANWNTDQAGNTQFDPPPSDNFDSSSSNNDSSFSDSSSGDLL